jgi:hypothetical protein
MNDQLSWLTAGLTAFNTLTLLMLAWRGGRWTGTVDTRLTHLEDELTRHLRGN